jgi:hemerythrin-like domain-containing protein/quercetin dioxygenase-like cupin family protein
MSSPHVKAKSASAITTKLVADHRHMETLLDELKDAMAEICQRQSPEALSAARTTAQHIVAEMNTHAACEEQALFPALAKYHPMPMLEMEHEEMLMQRAALVSGVLNYSFPEDCNDVLYRQGLDFIELLKRHMTKEEKAIFPLVEESLSPAEKQHVLAKMEDIRARARVIPTPERTPAEKQAYRFHMSLDAPVTKPVHTQVILEVGKKQIKTLLLQAGAELATHWTPYHAVMVLYAGEAQWIGQDQIIDLHAGDGLLMDPKLPHAVKAKTDCRFLIMLDE